MFVNQVNITAEYHWRISLCMTQSVLAHLYHPHQLTSTLPPSHLCCHIRPRQINVVCWVLGFTGPYLDPVRSNNSDKALHADLEHSTPTKHKKINENSSKTQEDFWIRRHLFILHVFYSRQFWVELLVAWAYTLYARDGIFLMFPVLDLSGRGRQPTFHPESSHPEPNRIAGMWIENFDFSNASRVIVRLYIRFWFTRD